MEAVVQKTLSSEAHDLDEWQRRPELKTSRNGHAIRVLEYALRRYADIQAARLDDC